GERKPRPRRERPAQGELPVDAPEQAVVETPQAAPAPAEGEASSKPRRRRGGRRQREARERAEARLRQGDRLVPANDSKAAAPESEKPASLLGRIKQRVKNFFKRPSPRH